MNWFVVQVVALVFCVLATIVSFAFVMANVEYGPARVAVAWAVPTLALAAADTLLLGLVWP